MSVDPKLQRYWDACTLGGRPIKPVHGEWRKALLEATTIRDVLDGQRGGATFDAVQLSPMIKLHDKRVSALEVGVSYQTILDLEVTWAELDFQVEELERVAKDIRDDLYRVRMMQKIEELKREIERKKTLRLVP